MHEMLSYLIDEYDLDERYLWNTREKAIKSCFYHNSHDSFDAMRTIESISHTAFFNLEYQLNNQLRFYAILALLTAFEKRVDAYNKKSTTKETEEIFKMAKSLFRFDSVIEKFDSRFEYGFNYEDEAKNQVLDKLNLVRQKLCAIRFEYELEQKCGELQGKSIEQYEDWYDKLYWRHHREDDDLFYGDPDKKENELMKIWYKLHPKPELSERNYKSVVQYYTWRLSEWRANNYLFHKEDIFRFFDNVISDLEEAIKTRFKEVTMITAAEDFMQSMQDELPIRRSMVHAFS